MCANYLSPLYDVSSPVPGCVFSTSLLLQVIENGPSFVIVVNNFQKNN